MPNHQLQPTDKPTATDRLQAAPGGDDDDDEGEAQPAAGGAIGKYSGVKVGWGALTFGLMWFIGCDFGLSTVGCWG
jgi:hypothetical protein